MNRKKKLFLNTVIPLLNQIITIVCGFILPRFFLAYYGSTVNGLVSSVTQFLGFISICECGVGAVVQSALYKPLAEKDDDGVSRIIISAERFFRKIGLILVVYVAVLTVAYPKIISNRFDFWYTASLILVISISSFAQYFFSMSYRLLLSADQLAYIQLGLNAVTLIINTVLCVILMKLGMGVQVVKLVSSLVFLIQPAVLVIYVKKHYRLNKKLEINEEPLKQKWNGLSQHIAAVVLGNTDVVVLTIFSTLENVSVYTVYYMVVNGIKQLITAVTTGVQALFGNMYAKQEKEKLNETFGFFEWLIHTAVTLLFTVTGILVVPFVKVYTSDITDINYVAPLFGGLLAAATAVYCLRLPYNIMVLAAGHYKQTQVSALIEAGINIIVSIAFVYKLGLIGVALGTLVAMLYRTCYLAYYLNKAILYRKIKIFIKYMLTDVLISGLMVLSVCWLTLGTEGYRAWIISAVEVTLICFAVSLLCNLIFYKKSTVKLFSAAKKVVVKLKKVKSREE